MGEAKKKPGRPKLPPGHHAKKAKERAKRNNAKRSTANLKPQALTGPKPMSKEDYDFCAAFVQLGKQEAAYRQVFPDNKYPGDAAMRMMRRDEIREHIRDIFRIIANERRKAAELSARASLLTLEVADDRLLEVLQTRRKTRGEMLTRDVKMLLVEGATPVQDENGKVVDYEFSLELKNSMLNEGAPVEDTDLLKAIDLTYKRKQGIIKPEKKPEVTVVNAMLYRPKWFSGPEKQAPMLEGA